MKNHYVMDRNSVMLHHDTLEGCKEWCRKQTAAWVAYGMTPHEYRIFYDSGTEPVATYNPRQN